MNQYKFAPDWVYAIAVICQLLGFILLPPGFILALIFSSGNIDIGNTFWGILLWMIVIGAVCFLISIITGISIDAYEKRGNQ